MPAGVGERLLDHARTHSRLSAAPKESFSHVQADLRYPGHRSVAPDQGLDHLGEGPAFFVFEAQVVDHLAQGRAAPDRIDRRL